MRPCFAFSAKTASKPAVLAIDDEIGFWGVQARDFRAALDTVEGDELRVEINSPGGDVFAGLGMFNMLRSFAASGKQVTTRVTGVAASIASIVMLAGDKREMPANSFAMIHAVSSGVWGSADEIRDHADTVDKIHGSVRNIYMDRMGVDEPTATEMMSKDTWMTADECLAAGFVTAISDPVQATAKFDMRRAALPAHVAAVFDAKADEPEPPAAPVVEIEPELPATPLAEAIVAAATVAGLEAHAKFFALSCDSLDTAKARMGAAREIVALCTVAGMQANASEHIRGGKSVADVRAALVEALAGEDVHVESAPRNQLNPTNGGSAKPAVVNSDSIWASHNSQKKGR